MHIVGCDLHYCMASIEMEEGDLGLGFALVRSAGASRMYHCFFVFLFHSSDSRLQLADCFVQSHPPYLLAGDDL